MLGTLVAAHQSYKVQNVYLLMLNLKIIEGINEVNVAIILINISYQSSLPLTIFQWCSGRVTLPNTYNYGIFFKIYAFMTYGPWKNTAIRIILHIPPNKHSRTMC